MSLRINDVKKVLRDTGVEMDADDILTVMRTRPPYRNLTRVQVAQSLGSLCESDPDIIRTRLGLYQHVNRPLTPTDRPLVDRAHVAPAPRRLALTTPSPLASDAVPQEPNLAAPPAGAVLVVEVPHLEAALARHAGHPVNVSDPDSAGDYLASLARLRLRRHDVDVAWCTGPVPAAAEATRRQWAGAYLILIASSHVTAEACITATQLHRPMTIWAPPPFADGARSAEPTQTLPLTELLHCCTTNNRHELDKTFHPADPPTDNPPPAPALPTPPGPPPHAPVSAAPLPTVLAAARPTSAITPVAGLASPVRAAATPPVKQAAAPGSEESDQPQLDCLWFLSVALYEQPVPGITGTGNTHTLRRQAHQLGCTYARRWWQVATDHNHDQLAASATTTSFDVPHHLYPDLLRFAEQHHLHLHRSSIFKDQLRRGFWTTVHALQQPNAAATPTARSSG